MHRSVTGVIAVMVALTLLAGCADDDGQADAAQAAQDQAVQDGDAGGAATRHLGVLDLETLEADTDEGTYEAFELENSFVGVVDEDLFIGVSVDGGEATVYLCDGDEVGVWLNGAIVEDDPTRLGGFEDGAYVEFAVDDERVTGSVRLAGQTGLHAFEATPAGEDAGLFRAEATFDDQDRIAGWVVLEDGRQQGSDCFPIVCCSGAFCWVCGCTTYPF